MELSENRTNRRIISYLVILVFFAIANLTMPDKASLAQDESSDAEKQAQRGFDRLSAGEWVEVLNDPGTDDWTHYWKLDGLEAVVINDHDGMELRAGPQDSNDAHHAVLWTKKSFTGDLKIEYEYTRTDERTRNVNIIYIHATGSGEGDFAEDIFAWSHLREVPAMRMYFSHMNTYHLSYAAFNNDNNDKNNDYIRMRRYMPEWGKGLKGTDIGPDHFKTGLFETGVPHRITIIKRGDEVAMRIENDKQTKVILWDTTKLPGLNEGRIGLRHMHTRNARYSNFRVSQLK